MINLTKSFFSLSMGYFEVKMSNSWFSLQCIFIASFLIFSLRLFFTTCISRHLPFPGPPRDWILGHVRVMPRKEHWKTFARWGEMFEVKHLSIISAAVVPFYILGRAVLLVIAVISLRSLPYGAYETVRWTTFIPHI